MRGRFCKTLYLRPLASKHNVDARISSYIFQGSGLRCLPIDNHPRGLKSQQLLSFLSDKQRNALDCLEYGWCKKLSRPIFSMASPYFHGVCPPIWDIHHKRNMETCILSELSTVWWGHVTRRTYFYYISTFSIAHILQRSLYYALTTPLYLISDTVKCMV